MRILTAFRLILALALGAGSARAQTSIRLVVPGLSPAPAVCPLVLPGAAFFTPALLTPVAGLSPSLLASPLAAPAQAAPLLILPAGAEAYRPQAEAFRGGALIRPLAAAPSAGDARAVDDFARRYAGYFDGAAAGADGAAVYPRLADLKGNTQRQPLQIDAVRSAVERALPPLRESVALGAWNGPNTTLDESCCGDGAPKLALLLRAQGIPARLVEAEFHYYVIIEVPDGQIVVDPTVRQFFGKKQAPQSVPQVFVGSVGDLHVFFQSHEASKTTKYAPHRIYFREAVVREDQLRALEAKVRAGGAPEHDPLHGFLGLPPAAPRPPSARRLIIP